MPVSWTPDNDRKLLLLMLKSAGVIHVNLAGIVAFMGSHLTGRNPSSLGTRRPY